MLQSEKLQSPLYSGQIRGSYPIPTEADRNIRTDFKRALIMTFVLGSTLNPEEGHVKDVQNPTQCIADDEGANNYPGFGKGWGRLKPCLHASQQ